MRRVTFNIVFILLMVFFSCHENSNDVSVNVGTKEKTQKEVFEIDRIEPPFWWVGFKKQEFQLLVHHKNISKSKPSISDPSISILKVHKSDSPNYVFIDLDISKVSKTTSFNINFEFSDGKSLSHTYTLKEREKDPEQFIGFNSTDAVYLITPDRFANGNKSNDIVEGLLEQTIDRTDNYARHGGDIDGIINNLDYINDLGFTSVWPCPLLENDMKKGSYHGYAITDYYNVDPRFGTNKDYQRLSNELDKRGMKLIMDQVANHCGLEHWWMKDLPFKDWVNYQKHFEDNRDNWNHNVVIKSNHRRTSNQDIYASKVDKKGMTDGWFVATMPDLNQKNPFMAKYIIQNSIWWIEYLKLGGIRQDTYPYPDKKFMSDWAGAIMTEYPNFKIVGEEWSYNPLLIAYWQDGNNNKDGYKSNLTSTMDFAMQQNIVDALNETESWDKGLVKIYEGLANDFAYTKPEDIMVFTDNHDMSRVHTQLNGNIENTKMALGYMLSLPRIPQVYYGTEILMADFEKPGDHGLIRSDFPGGWEGDEVNAFTGKGLTSDQKGMQTFLKRFLNYRKDSKAIHNGETLHFAPREGIYTLIRRKDSEVITVILNKTEKTKLDISYMQELQLEEQEIMNVISGEKQTWKNQLSINSKGITIFTTKINN